MSTPTPLLSVKNLSVSFRLEDGSEFQALRQIHFNLPENKVLALVGESGSGKSVAALALMGLLPKETSRIHADSSIVFAGQNLLHLPETERRKMRGRDMAMIFQDPMTSLNPVHKVKHQIAETLILHQAMGKSQALLRALELLHEVGMQDPASIAESYPHQMSGGQQQRVMIAMALACRPKLMIADEPTTALDVTIQKQVLELMISLQATHRMALLFITHDLALVQQFADHLVVMRQGEIREQGEAHTIFQQPKDAYTRALLDCRPPHQGRPKRLSVIQDFLPESSAIGGSSPAPINPDRHEQESLWASEAEPLLIAKQINTWLGKDSFFSNRKRTHIVRDVSFVLRRGKTLGIVGESGSGKTTLGLSLLRLFPSQGELWLEGKDLFSIPMPAFMPYRKRMQIIFQNPLASLNPRFTIGEVLMEPMRIHAIGNNAKVRQEKAMRLLDQVGLPRSAWNRYPHEFSGGQCQRIAIARCLTLNPEILICDESVSALDVSIQSQILNLLKDLQDAYQLSYLFISHDLNIVRYISHEVMVMHRGQVVEANSADLLFAQPESAYTKTLIHAVPHFRTTEDSRSLAARAD
jgi:peptide/nickel transport system ATP-binding protein